MKGKETKIMCVNCVHCKTRNGTIRCAKKYFDDLQYAEVIILSPYDFDCWQFDPVDD